MRRKKIITARKKYCFIKEYYVSIVSSEDRHKKLVVTIIYFSEFVYIYHKIILSIEDSQCCVHSRNFIKIQNTNLLQTHQGFSNEIVDRIWTLLYDLNISKNILFWMK